MRADITVNGRTEEAAAAMTRRPKRIDESAATASAAAASRARANVIKDDKETLICRTMTEINLSLSSKSATQKDEF